MTRACKGLQVTLVEKLDSLLAERPNDRVVQKFIDYGRFAVETGAAFGVTGFCIIKGSIRRWDSLHDGEQTWTGVATGSAPGWIRAATREVFANGPQKRPTRRRCGE
jgi:hypothetical protein